MKCPKCDHKLKRTLRGYRCVKVWDMGPWSEPPVVCGYTRRQLLPPHYVAITASIAIVVFGAMAFKSRVDGIINRNYGPDAGIKAHSAPEAPGHRAPVN